MTELPVWTCAVEAAKDGPKLEELNVGAKFRLNCKGDIPVAWTADPVSIALPKAAPEYALVILNTEQVSPQNAQFTVTSYRPGDQAPEYIRVLQGERGFESPHVKWSVKSILKPDAQPPKPYPSFGPWGIAMPVWIWVTLGLLVTVLVVAGGLRLRRAWQRRRVRELLRQQRTSLAPAHQFYRDARALRRRLHQDPDPRVPRDVTGDLNKEFRMYILREFEVPALEWTDAQTLRDLERRHKSAFAAAGPALAKGLRELTRLAARSDASVTDVEQVLAMSIDAVEQLDRAGRSR